MGAKRTTLQILQDEQRQYKRYQAELKVLTGEYNSAYNTLMRAQSTAFQGYTPAQARQLTEKAQRAYNRMMAKQNQILRLSESIKAHDAKYQLEHSEAGSIKRMRACTGSKEAFTGNLRSTMQHQAVSMRRAGVI